MDSLRSDGGGVGGRSINTVVILIYLFLSLSSATEFELEKLSSTVSHCRSPYWQWPI